VNAAATRQRARDLTALPLVALELLTVLRLRPARLVEPRLFGRAQAFFPAVGLLLGGAATVADSVAHPALGAGVSGWLVVALLLLLTGGLHADGLADSFDGLFLAGGPERRLEVMRDARIGAFGAAGLFVTLGLKAAAIAALPPAHRAAALVLGPCLSRWAAVVAMAAFPYARPAGLGEAFHAAAWPWAAPFAGVTALAAAAALLGPIGAGAAVMAGALGLALGSWVSSRLGGLSGDSYGAVIELVEVAVVLAAVAVW
jgi:adenosylcobinamide-GDP ribazoletransferase